MTNRFEEIERQLIEQRQKMERASIQQQAHVQLEHEQRQRANDDARAVQNWQAARDEIRALLSANTAAVAAWIKTADGMVAEGIPNFPVLRDLKAAVDATIAPIAEVTARAQYEANSWYRRQPGFDMGNPMGIGMQINSPFREPLPTAIDSTAMLESWVTTSAPDVYGMRATIAFYLTGGTVYRRIDQTRDLAPVLTVRPSW